jgi:hypothetical protein
MLTWWRKADLLRIVLVSVFTAFLVVIHCLDVIGTDYDGLRSHCGRKNSDQSRLREPHDGVW